ANLFYSKLPLLTDMLPRFLDSIQDTEGGESDATACNMKDLERELPALGTGWAGTGWAGDLNVPRGFSTRGFSDNTNHDRIMAFLAEHRGNYPVEDGRTTGVAAQLIANATVRFFSQWANTWSRDEGGGLPAALGETRRLFPPRSRPATRG
ncbi:unnamed protein product, partial [Amoebophrya sp. A120]